jgi:hypothetical protein
MTAPKVQITPESTSLLSNLPSVTSSTSTWSTCRGLQQGTRTATMTAPEVQITPESPRRFYLRTLWSILPPFAFAAYYLWTYFFLASAVH